jgi:monoamine oxidase
VNLDRSVGFLPSVRPLFLGGSVAPLLFFGLGSGTVLGDAAPAAPRQEAAVVIVGAGLTGLTVAHELRKAGIDDVVLLEALPRAGGRIQTVAFPDGVHVEAHMEEYWERSPAYPLLKELGLELEEDVAHSTVRMGGKVYPYQGEGDRDTYLKGIFTEAERQAFVKWSATAWGLYEKLHHSMEAGGPLPPELAALTKVSFKAWVTKSVPPRVADWIRVTVEPEQAIEWDKVSALDGLDEVRLFLDTPQGFGEKNFHVSGGNTRFVNALLDRVGRERVLTEAQVTAIEHSEAGATVRYLHQGTTYREVKARAVVVTVPLYLLKRIQFLPALSAQKQKAIDTTRFGAYIKVHVRVAAAAAPLWQKDGETLLTMLSDSNAGSIYEATAFQENDPGADRYLTALVHARYAQLMLGMNADGMREHAVKSLDALFPGLAKHVKLVELFVYPTAVAYWPLELGRSRYDELARELRRPQGRVWIGGDTTENSHSEGAVQAGQRMARELVAMKAQLVPALAAAR